jgi:Transposase DDE domain group 1
MSTRTNALGCRAMPLPPGPCGFGAMHWSYSLGTFMRMLTMPKTAGPWSLIGLREKLIKIGAKAISHGRYVTFQLAEVAVSRQMFAEILPLIARLRTPPARP